MLSLKTIVDHLVHILIVINAIFYGYSVFKKQYNKAFYFVTIYLVIGCFLQLYMLYLASYKNNNLWVIHIYFVMQFILLSLFYKSMFNAIQQRLVLVVGLIVVFLLGPYYILDTSKMMSFNLFDIFITTLPIIAYSIIHLYNSLTKEGRFLLFNSAVLIYFSTSTLILFLGSIIQVNGDIAPSIALAGKRIWMINNVMFLFYQVIILIEWKRNISKWKIKKIS